MITPVIEVDGREKVVDAYNSSKKTGAPRNNLMMYWGKYVQHDNNRDGMGQFLKLHAEHRESRARVAPHGPARSA